MCISPRPTMPIVWPPIRSTSECKNDDRTNKGGKKFPAAQATAAAATGRPARRRVPVPSSPPPPSVHCALRVRLSTQRDERLRPGGGREAGRKGGRGFVRPHQRCYFSTFQGKTGFAVHFAHGSPLILWKRASLPICFQYADETPSTATDPGAGFAPTRERCPLRSGMAGPAAAAVHPERGAREWSSEYVKKRGEPTAVASPSLPPRSLPRGCRVWRYSGCRMKMRTPEK